MCRRSASYSNHACVTGYEAEKINAFTGVILPDFSMRQLSLSICYQHLCGWSHSQKLFVVSCAKEGFLICQGVRDSSGHGVVLVLYLTLFPGSLLKKQGKEKA